jgi:hypothetical protein
VQISNSIFRRNRVASIEATLQCNNDRLIAGAAPTFVVRNNVFDNNTNTVASVSLLYCTRAMFTDNEFVNNNNDYRFGALKVVVEPSEGLPNQFQISLSGNRFTNNQGTHLFECI